jgi:hypothetical protein
MRLLCTQRNPLSKSDMVVDEHIRKAYMTDEHVHVHTVEASAVARTVRQSALMFSYPSLPQTFSFLFGPQIAHGLDFADPCGNDNGLFVRSALVTELRKPNYEVSTLISTSATPP